MRHRRGVAEVVDRDDLDLGPELLLGAEEVSPDASETVDADANRHDSSLSSKGRCLSRVYPGARLGLPVNRPLRPRSGLRNRPSAFILGRGGSALPVGESRPRSPSSPERARWGRRSSSELLPQARRSTPECGLRSAFGELDEPRQAPLHGRLRRRWARPRRELPQRHRRVPETEVRCLTQRLRERLERAGALEGPCRVELPLRCPRRADEVRVVGIREPVRLGSASRRRRSSPRARGRRRRLRPRAGTPRSPPTLLRRHARATLSRRPSGEPPPTSRRSGGMTRRRASAS